MSQQPKDINKNRRRFLIDTSIFVGAIGGAVVTASYTSSFSSGKPARTSGAAVKVDISKLEFGSQITVEWRSQPVWILRRNQEILDRLKQDSLVTLLLDPESRVNTQQPDYANNDFRSSKEEYLVVIGICTHVGCVPTFRPELAPVDLGKDWPGGYFCPCHGSRYDFAGRVYKGVPAPNNLVIPPYHYVSETIIEIGIDPLKQV